jgi:hypothetical protein
MKAEADLPSTQASAIPASAERGVRAALRGARALVAVQAVDLIA